MIYALGFGALVGLNSGVILLALGDAFGWVGIFAGLSNVVALAREGVVTPRPF